MNALALFPAVTSEKAWIHDQLAGLVGVVAEHVPDLKVVHRDLAGLAPAEAPKLHELAAVSRDGSPRCATRDCSDQLVRELEDAELVVIGAPIGYHQVKPALAEWYRRARSSKGYGAPLYAMGLNPGLEAWFGHAIRADRTFRYTVEGPRGLLAGKKALVLAARTGPRHNPAMEAHQVQCIETQLRFMGIHDIAVIASDRDADPVRRPRRWQARFQPPLAA